jgi:heme-degrading monooxygenase HmoA
MIFEVATFSVASDARVDFEQRFETCAESFNSIPGFISHGLMCSLETDSYRLFVVLGNDRDKPAFLNAFSSLIEPLSEFISPLEFEAFKRAQLRNTEESVLEVAMLNVIPGRESEFELAFKQASKTISSMNGFIHLQLQRCLERPNAYVLLVNWETLEDHTVGFRQSPEYQEWRALLHHFYDPFPTVEHFVPVNLE